jgi:hypothetical protein
MHVREMHAWAIWVLSLQAERRKLYVTPHYVLVKRTLIDLVIKNG